MVMQTILITLIAIFGKCEYLLGTSLIQRPIIIGTLVGLAMGDLHAGVIMGATLELAFVGAVSIGAYIPPDMLSGTILGTAFAIKAGMGPEAALTLGMPIATIMLAIKTITGSPIMLFFTHLADKHVAEGNEKMFTFDVIGGGLIATMVTMPIIPLAFYLGSDAVTALLGGLPTFIQQGMDIACGMIPALGFAMLAQMIMNKKVAPYFFIGYFLVAYLGNVGVGTTAVALFACLMAAIQFFKDEPKLAVAKTINSNAEDGGALDEF